MSHLTQPNKKVSIPYEYEINRTCGNGDMISAQYMSVYTFEMEPVMRRLANGELHESWRSIPITSMTDEEVTEYLHFEKWLHKNEYKVKKVGLWEALHIFKENVFSICYDHIYADDNPEYWQDLLNQLQNQDNLKMQQKIKRAREMPIEELVRKYGYEPRMSFICCPFHGEKTPSLKIYSHNNTWHCFGCNKGSSTIDFVMLHNNYDFKEAVDYLT